MKKKLSDKMLQTSVPFENIAEIINMKCGEIICESLSRFRMKCSFCEIKLFEFDDFLQHFRNVHFKELLASTEASSSAQLNTKLVREEVNETVGRRTLRSSNKPKENVTNTPKKKKKKTAMKKEINLDRSSVECHLAYLASPQLKEEHESDINSDNDDKFALSEAVHWKSNMSEIYEHPENDEQSNDEQVKDEQSNDEQSNDDLSTNADDAEGETVLKKEKSLGPQRKLTCGQCDKTYINARRLQMHIEGIHLKAKTHECDECDEAFRESSHLDTHKREKHIGFQCPKCPKMFQSRRGQRMHLDSHKTTKDFVCDHAGCTKAFVNKKRLKTHQRIHAFDFQYNCQQCGYKTRYREALLTHMRGHTGEKPYVCKECGKSFGSAALVLAHKTSHATERPLKCDVCGKTFARSKSLYLHKFLHDEVKRFVCKICEKPYAQPTGLAAHMRSHNV